MVLAFYTFLQLIGYSLCIDKRKILGQGCLIDLTFFETPVANLGLNCEVIKSWVLRGRPMVVRALD